ncbi:MAG: alpha/beta hydrolase [Lachnospiraceae bacterium]|nr:alpha/beta hydrolase [Lachnospiraceae bacterium]
MEISKTIYSCKHTEYDAVYTPDIVFAHRDCGDLTLQIVSPIPSSLPPKEENFYNPIREKFIRWHKEQKEEERPVMQPEVRRFPLIVDCPGSGWSGADGHAHVPYMVYLAKKGFVAASISYRGTYRNNVIFPAAVQDLKEAVRYLRANAEMFHIDHNRVGLLGDSSGGNTAALAALTSDTDEEFNIGENLDKSSAVKACCCVYGPVDLINLVQDRVNEHKRLRPEEGIFPEGMPFEAMEIWQDTYKSDPEGCLKAASPYYYIDSDKKLPPFLFVQGDEDPIIPMAQGLRFCDRLRECGGRAEFLKIAGGEHGGGVWSEEMLDYVTSFFKTYIG